MDNVERTSMKEELEVRFTYHKPTIDTAERHTAIRAKAQEFACMIVAMCPSSREQSLALTKAEEAAMWAYAAIDHREVEAPAEAELREPHPDRGAGDQ